MTKSRLRLRQIHCMLLVWWRQQLLPWQCGVPPSASWQRLRRVPHRCTRWLRRMLLRLLQQRLGFDLPSLLHFTGLHCLHKKLGHTISLVTPQRTTSAAGPPAMAVSTGVGMAFWMWRLTMVRYALIGDLA